jgi:3-(3-hydroxy-phenyl)propionate hydroxylase
MAEEPAWGTRRDDKGIHAVGKLEDGKRVRVMVTEQHLGSVGEPTLRDLSEALIAVYGTDYGIHSPTWISRFTDLTRQAAAYRDRRVLLAGDAAHVHSTRGLQRRRLGRQPDVLGRQRLPSRARRRVRGRDHDPGLEQESPH